MEQPNKYNETEVSDQLSWSSNDHNVLSNVIALKEWKKRCGVLSVYLAVPH